MWKQSQIWKLNHETKLVMSSHIKTQQSKDQKRERVNETESQK